MDETLLERTYRLLECAPGPLRQIAEGADVGYPWLQKFKQRAHSNPGIKSVQKLHDYLDSMAAQDSAA